MADRARAADRIRARFRQERRIAVFGDYDSTA
jgi:single-stranded DNA-specific DHH superfamily exonuclease